MKTQKSVSGVPERSVPEEKNVCVSGNRNSSTPSNAFTAACFCALIVPSAMWAYEGRIVLAASAATFVGVYLLGRAVMWNLRKVRRLGYVSTEAICRAAKGDRA